MQVSLKQWIYGPNHNEYLQAGGVFTSDLIETWIDYKRTHEIAPIQLRPHPHEFELYFDL